MKKFLLTLPIIVFLVACATVPGETPEVTVEPLTVEDVMFLSGVAKERGVLPEVMSEDARLALALFCFATKKVSTPMDLQADALCTSLIQSYAGN